MRDAAMWMNTLQGPAGPVLPEAPDAVDGARRVVLFGPPGIGKTTAAAVLGRRLGLPVLRLAPRPQDVQVPYAGLLELALALPSPAARELTAELDESADEPGTSEPAGTALRLRRLSVALLRDASPMTLVVDNAQWLDPASAAVLGWALRLTPGLPAIVADRAWRPEAGVHWCGENALAVRVAALTSGQVAALLSHLPLSTGEVARIHASSGGNPALVLALADAAPPPSDRVGGSEPFLPPAARRLMDEWLNEVPAHVQELLAFAALDDRPDLELLVRLAGPAAGTLLAQAETAGLVDIGREDGRVRLTASAIGAELMTRLPASARRRLHTRLAEAGHDPLRRDRHTALAAAGTVDSRTALHTARAADRARLRGEHVLAAELALLAADLTPREDTHLVTERALTAIRDAAHCADLSRGRAATRLLLQHEDRPAPRVQALLALLDASGQRLNGADELFAGAVHEAAGQPDLIAQILLRQAIRANLNEGAPEQAAALAAQAAALAQAAGDTTTTALALTMQARVQRVLGSPGTDATLERALRTPRTALVAVNATPEHLAARHALFDDRLSEARTLLLPLLFQAQQAGDAEGTVDVLRGLAEVEIRAGRCAQALDYAARAQALTDSSGLPAGPACYTSALVEGTAARTGPALAIARRGAEACRREGNRVFLSRNLYALGHLLLVTGRAKEALEALEEVRGLEALQQVHDPSILRWHADMAESLITLGHLEQAHELLSSTHRSATDLGRQSVIPSLERVQALLDAAHGDYDTAARRLTDAAGRLSHLPIERGRTLLALSHTERRGRRRANAREAARSAADLFTAHEAHPWAQAAADSLNRLERNASDHSGRPSLTQAEQRCARLAAGGASNRDIAAALTVSVKTVEATLTRVYRKLGLHSRVQLAHTVGPASE
ncbi:LuxR family transcriptional regulator [Streptomyces sp. SID9727]|uniref:helix-turn-helix transcriptional regulator n=1 Tax=Streptomyces sp. SID9727 TaxID=2706114 RepID=UPI0013CCA377|nr:LuxR family transcriptional regulator [Streptomyces sp. SID9727]NEC67124.1 AAA family ATPase [Streptomyces sp. SID9727]